MRTQFAYPVSVLWLAATISGPRVGADEIVLKSGGRLGGEVVAAETSNSRLLFRSQEGVLIAIPASLVAEVKRTAPQVVAYRQLAPTIPDLADSQWKLAEWCRQRGMKQQRQQHLRRVIELDPGHERARRALGYSQIEGRWTTQREVLTERGFVYHRGKWRLRQEIELIKVRRREKELERQWLLDLKHWRSQLETENSRQAMARILSIQDHHVVPAVEELLRQDRNRQARLLYVELLGKIPGNRSMNVVIQTAMHDQDEEIFYACVDQIEQRKTPEIVRRFAQALQNDNNRVVNRAGFTLGQLGDATTVGPLIEALVTTHSVIIPGSSQTTFTLSRPTHNLPMGSSASHPTTAGAGFGPLLSSIPVGAALTGPRRAQRVPYQVANQQVLDALVKLTGGVSFNFDQPAWRAWYTVQLNRRQFTKARYSLHVQR